MSALGTRELPGVSLWRRRAARLGTYLGLAVISVVMLYPFWSMGIASFRSLEQYTTGHGFSLSSWRQLFATLPVGHELLSSAIVTVGAIAVILAVSTTAGYALGVLRYRFSAVVFLFVISAMMVPMQSMILPEYVNLSRIGFINHYYGAILVYAALGTPFSTFLMTTYFRRMPEDVVEASLIDGLGYGKIFLRMMLPLALPAIFTVTVLQFIQIWDDLLVGLLFLQTPDLRPITVGLATIPSQHLLDVPVLMAGSLMSALPAIVVYLVFQRYLITGLTMGMSK
ncbi:MAG: raffinose/stachyose/melibiose transport system permease protein [Gaiellaceae bacterium]|jgi:multiple sugar transport system permease protein/raffinose/stachyose/melibiose transport system permease protein|nr:raffinose/stachyose/melibiose transport system permease protein [Gaiellaceae bacterium]